MSNFPLLSVLVFAPWLGALVVAVLPERTSRGVSLLASLTTLGGALAMVLARPESDFVDQVQWIPALGIRYVLFADELGRMMLLLTGIVAPVCLLASWNVAGNSRVFRALFLFLQGSALGVFVAQDFFLWFLFWELSLVPAFFLIKLWGGPEATRAAYQFVIYTIGGSAFMLAGFAAVYAVHGSAIFPLLAPDDVATKLAAITTDGRFLGVPVVTLVFFGIFLGLAVKVPLFPFHTWLPSTYAEAPIGVSMFLTAIMSKMGVYGFLRILAPIFPAELKAAAPVLIWLALAGIVFGAFAAIAQRDLKRMLGYSSINHVSYCLLALFALFAYGDAVAAAAPEGAPARALSQHATVSSQTYPGILLQIFNHGLSAAALFFFVGILETRAAGRRGLNDFGGVRTAAPVFAGLCGIAMFSSLGLPGLNGFVGEFLIFRSVFMLTPWAAAVACLGLLATAMFLLTFYQRVFHGPARAVAATGFRDLTRAEIATVAPLIVLMFVLGVFPQLLIGLIHQWSILLPGGVAP